MPQRHASNSRSKNPREPESDNEPSFACGYQVEDNQILAVFSELSVAQMLQAQPINSNVVRYLLS